MLIMSRQLAVLGFYGPSVRKYINIRCSNIHHRLNSKCHTLMEFDTVTCCSVIGNAWVFVQFFADSVSAAKTGRLIPLFKKLEGLKPNAMEAHELTGCERPEFAARVLLDMGIKRVFISQGADGMLACSRDESIIQPRVQARVVNTTGAGDSATAAMVWAIAQGMSLADCARAAAAAGAITVASEYTNAPELSSAAVLSLMAEN